MNFFESEKRIIRKETAWTLSNIAVGNRKQIQHIIDNDLISPILERLEDSEQDVVRESCWCIFNLIEGSSRKQLDVLIAESTLESLCELLEHHDAKILKIVLESIETILSRGQKQAQKDHEDNPYLEPFESCGGLNKLELLQVHPNTEIYNLAVTILEKYFDAVDIEELDIEAMQPKYDTKTTTLKNFVF